VADVTLVNYSRCLQRPKERRQRKWFGQQSAEAGLFCFTARDDPAAAGEQDFDARDQRMQALAKFDAAHAGHFEVGHDKIIVARGGGEGA